MHDLDKKRGRQQRRGNVKWRRGATVMSRAKPASGGAAAIAT